jgi:hypothetical protein
MTRPFRARTPVIRSWIFAALAFMSLAAGAEEPAPAGGSNEGASLKSDAKRMGRDIGAAGKKIGQDFSRLGKQVGEGTSKAVKSVGQKISSDVKTKNFKPKTNSAARPEKSGRGDDQR